MRKPLVVEAFLLCRSGAEFPDPVGRISRPTFEGMIAHYEGDEVDSLGPDGPAVERVNANGSIHTELGRVLHRLVVDQHVRCDGIVV